LGDGPPLDEDDEEAASETPPPMAEPSEDVAADRRAILERLARGEIDAAAAAVELRELAGS
jgi:hypothetical protein